MGAPVRRERSSPDRYLEKVVKAHEAARHTWDSPADANPTEPPMLKEIEGAEGAKMDLEQTKMKTKTKKLPKVDKRMLAAMKKRYLRWKKRKENQKDWSKVHWTHAQVHDAKRTAKAAEKADTAEVVADYMAGKAHTAIIYGKKAADRIWNNYKKSHPGAHESGADAVKGHVKKAMAGLKKAVKKMKSKKMLLEEKRIAKSKAIMEDVDMWVD